MSSTKILAASLSLLSMLLAAGCTREEAPGGSTSSSSPRTPTAGAASVHGDLAPTTLVPLSIPKPSEGALLRGAGALPPGETFTPESPAPEVVARDFHRVVTSAAGLRFPLDAPQGALILVRTGDGTPLTTVHVRDVTSGARLDHAHGADNTSPVSRTGNVSNEPAFASLLDARRLSIDEPYTHGQVELDLPAGTLGHGIVIDVRQPTSRIALTGGVDELVHGAGETAELHFGIADGETAIDGATLSGWAEYPNHQRSPDLTISALGNGKYVARIPLAGAANIGTWGIHVKASGTSGGVDYERDVATAFAYQPSHARMTAFGSPVINRAADGLIDEVTVDVDVETLATDRFGVRGTLTFDGPDGHEHPLAQAQTGQVINAGKGTITLHFTADVMALAQVDGPFHLRDVALVSQAYGITQHRVGLGLDLSTHAMASTELRYPKLIPLQAQDLIAAGDLPPARLVK